MRPLRIGPAGRRLFALHQAPAAQPRRHGVVLCAPFGQEAIRAHRLMRVLAERLAREGFDALRFDYFGTGDSDGEDAEGTLAHWIEDVASADAHSRDLVGGPVSWFGLRLGATLAALASARAALPPERLVLWDPILDGRAYVAALERAHAAALSSFPGADADIGHDEALGFPLGATLRAELAEVGAHALAHACARRVHLLPGADGGNQALHDATAALAARGIPVASTPVASDIDWTSDQAMNTSIVPAEALQAIVRAFREGP